jgi:predicted nucleic acid-binding protein
MKGSAFADTNVLLYLVGGDPAKADRAEELLAEGPTISVQVLNEFAAVCSRRRVMSWTEIREALAAMRAVVRVEPLTVQTHDRALALAERYGVAWYDALIPAAALGAACSVLWSEDFQDGQVLDKTLVVRNPFT